MDEPMAGIDASSRSRLAEICQAAKDDGVTILLVLHELGELAPVLDRELHIRSGHFTYDGPARSELRDPHSDHCNTANHPETEGSR